MDGIKKEIRWFVYRTTLLLNAVQLMCYSPYECIISAFCGLAPQEGAYIHALDGLTLTTSRIGREHDVELHQRRQPLGMIKYINHICSGISHSSRSIYQKTCCHEKTKRKDIVFHSKI